MRTGVRGGLGPGCGFAGGFNGVANVFAIAERSFAEEAAIGGADGEGVTGIGAGLFAGNEEFYGVVNWGRGRCAGTGLRG